MYEYKDLMKMEANQMLLNQAGSELKKFIQYQVGPCLLSSVIALQAGMPAAVKFVEVRQPEQQPETISFTNKKDQFPKLPLPKYKPFNLSATTSTATVALAPVLGNYSSVERSIHEIKMPPLPNSAYMDRLRIFSYLDPENFG